MSIVGKDRNICNICRSSGSYVRLQVEDSQDHRGAPTTTAPDAFAVLMAWFALFAYLAWSPPRENKLYIDLICLVDGMELKWQSGEVNSGKSFLTTLTNALWYIDGIMKALLVGVAKYQSCSSHLKGTMSLSCQSTENDKVQTWIAIHSVCMSHPCMMLSSCHGFAPKIWEELN